MTLDSFFYDVLYSLREKNGSKVRFKDIFIIQHSTIKIGDLCFKLQNVQNKTFKSKQTSYKQPIHNCLQNCQQIYKEEIKKKNITCLVYYKFSMNPA